MDLYYNNRTYRVLETGSDLVASVRVGAGASEALGYRRCVVLYLSRSCLCDEAALEDWIRGSGVYHTTAALQPTDVRCAHGSGGLKMYEICSHTLTFAENGAWKGNGG